VTGRQPDTPVQNGDPQIPPAHHQREPPDMDAEARQAGQRGHLSVEPDPERQDHGTNPIRRTGTSVGGQAGALAGTVLMDMKPPGKWRARCRRPTTDRVAVFAHPKAAFMSATQYVVAIPIMAS